MSELKDLAMANSIREMAELGRFDTSLSAYGFVYWDKAHGRRYCLGSQQKIIAERMRELRLNKHLPSLIYMKNRTIPNYAGSVEPEENQLKIDLALELQSAFSDEDLANIAILGDIGPSDVADKAMEKWKDALVGMFLPEQLQLYAGTLDHFRMAKKLSEASYSRLRQWVLGEYQQIRSEILTSGAGKKTFWGFAALTGSDNAWHFFADANVTAIIEQENRMRLQGYIVTPLWSNTLQMCRGQAPYTLRKPFLAQLAQIFDETYCAFFLRMWAASSPITEKQYQDVASQIRGTGSGDLLKLYANIWGLYRK